MPFDAVFLLHQRLFDNLWRSVPGLLSGPSPAMATIERAVTLPWLPPLELLVFAAGNLPGLHREIFLMSYVGALSVDDIAARLAVPRNDVIGALQVAGVNVRRYFDLIG